MMKFGSTTPIASPTMLWDSSSNVFLHLVQDVQQRTFSTHGTERGTRLSFTSTSTTVRMKEATLYLLTPCRRI